MGLYIRRMHMTHPRINLELACFSLSAEHLHLALPKKLNIFSRLFLNIFSLSSGKLTIMIVIKLTIFSITRTH